MADRLRHCQLSEPVSVINIWWSAATLITSAIKICIQQLGQVEEIVWLPYDAGLSAAVETLVGIFKRVIVTFAVYPRFFNFFTLTFRALGTNDVMSEIECTQQHNELLGRRHSTLQSHGLFALAKHLFPVPPGREVGYGCAN